MTIEIDAHPERREEAISAAHRILADIAHHSDDTLADACNTLLALSRDPHDRTLATELLKVLKPTPRPTPHGTRPATPTDGSVWHTYPLR